MDPFLLKNKTHHKRYITSRTTTELFNEKEVFRQIPAPFIPVFPVMSLDSLFPFSHPQIPSLYKNNKIQYYTAGRYALFQALKEISANKKDEILVPAYHCKAMIYPILDAGFIPVFYKINEDFSANISNLESLITTKTKAIIAVNYFGFFQNILEVRKICDQHDLRLIEDCAHSLFGHANNIAAGQTGDYAFGSTKKFFPVELGGILIRNVNFTQENQLTKVNITSEFRFIYNIIERSLTYGRLWIFKPLVFLIEKMQGRKTQEITGVAAPTDDSGEEYAPQDRKSQPTKLSMFLERRVSHHRICVKRRENYTFLVNALKDIQDITLPITDIPAGTVPYMLPIIIKDLEKIFPKIEDAALPFQRFGQFLWATAEGCPVSQKYAKTILQLPCHQELSESELQWIVDRLKRIILTRSKN